MLENIAISISTLIFLLCNFVVSSFAYTPVSDATVPVSIVESTQNDAIDAEFLVGEWISGSRTFIFTKNGELICADQTMPFELNGNILSVDYKTRSYKLPIVQISDRVIKLNDLTLFRTTKKAFSE